MPGPHMLQTIRATAEVWTARLADMGVDESVALTSDDEWDALLAEVRSDNEYAKRPLFLTNADR